MRTTALILSLCLAAAGAHGDEGMWQAHQLPQLGEQLERLGLEVDPRQLNDLTGHPMAAIVGLIIGLNGCSASFVSPEGLAVTNHHCVQGWLQHNSTPERNLLADGYFAEHLDDELPGPPGSRIFVTVEVSDVTDAMVDGLSADSDGLTRQRTLEDREKKLIADCERAHGYRCQVAGFYEGLRFYLIKRLEIRDVRLVYVPPRGIGQYGGDVDNWMWPRHTGDFSFLRAYVGADGSPADYAQDNVPYDPEHYLAVSTRGLKEGDFTMAAGYPRRTYRHRLAVEADDVSAWYYPTRKQRYENMLATIERETADRPEAAIKYSPLVQWLDNEIKNYGGMIEGFERSGLVERKQRQETEFAAWLETHTEHGQSLARLRALVDEYRDGRELRDIYDGFLRRHAKLLNAAVTLYRLSVESEKPDAERKLGFQERDRGRIRERMTRLERSFDARVDRALFERHLRLYAALPEAQRLADFDSWFGMGESFDVAAATKKLSRAYAETDLGRTDERLAWLDAEPQQFRDSTDPFIAFAVALYDDDLEREELAETYRGRFQYARSQYMAALQAWYESLGKPLYPDANATLRVTYGTVKGYSPRDAVSYKPFTTLQGILEKHTGEEPFDTPAPLLAAIGQRNYGMFAANNGDLPVNFVATLDSTLGNSGSAVLDGRAELVGLLFDGNYESINADWYFDARVARTICVDVRYVLWIMDSVDGAHRLLREMGIGRDSLHALRNVE